MDAMTSYLDGEMDEEHVEEIWRDMETLSGDHPARSIGIIELHFKGYSDKKNATLVPLG